MALKLLPLATLLALLLATANAHIERHEAVQGRVYRARRSLLQDPDEETTEEPDSDEDTSEEDGEDGEDAGDGGSQSVEEMRKKLTDQADQFQKAVEAEDGQKMIMTFRDWADEQLTNYADEEDHPAE